MVNDLELCSLGDPLHFSHPVSWTPGWSRKLTVPALVDSSDWAVASNDIWCSYQPTEQTVAEQGWKIHVSATVNNITRVLQVLSDYCAQHRIPFKHVRSLAMVATITGRSGSRELSGKAIAVYPRDVTQFRRTADALAVLLEDEPAPYVLSDRRWADRSPVFFRYGAFRPAQTWMPDGRRVAARLGADGQLVEDSRQVPFRVPDDVDIPHAIRERCLPFTGALDMPVRITAAITQSGCGGVYRGRLLEDDSPVVVKEARPFTGIMPGMDSAIQRLQHEADVLRSLSGVSAPKLRAEFVLDTHLFVAADECAGGSLQHWIAENHPLLRPCTGFAGTAQYLEQCQEIVTHLRKALRDLHAAGWAHNDLHPRNVIVDDDLSVALIDFEFAAPPESTSAPSLMCPGYATASGTALERDEFALDMVHAALLHPSSVTGLLELDPGTLKTAAGDVSRWFGTRHAEPVATAASRYAKSGRRALHVTQRSGHRIGPAPDVLTEDSLVRYLLAVAAPGEQTLIPGGPPATAGPMEALSIAHGASGAILALLSTGATPPASWIDDLQERCDGPETVFGSPGLWEGWAGVALTWARLGDLPRARRAMSQAEQLALKCTDPGLAAGVAGFAMVRVILAEHLNVDEGADTARRLLDDLAADPTTWGARCQSQGLLDGPAGVAAALAQATGFDRRPNVDNDSVHPWLRASRHYLGIDLNRCHRTEQGSMELLSGDTGLPYLAAGSAGLALAAAVVTEACEATPSPATEALARAARIEIVSEPGLTQGRLGLAYALDRLTRAGQVDQSATEWRDRHLAMLTRQAVSVDDGVGLCGNGSGRLSGDVATGAAGALLTLTAIREPRHSVLDLLLACPPVASIRTQDNNLVRASGTVALRRLSSPEEWARFPYDRPRFSHRGAGAPAHGDLEGG